MSAGLWVLSTSAVGSRNGIHDRPTFQQPLLRYPAVTRHFPETAKLWAPFSNSRCVCGMRSGHMAEGDLGLVVVSVLRVLWLQLQLFQ